MFGLVVVDMLNDFVRREGALYVKNSEKIVEPIRRVLKEMRGKARVIYLVDSHTKEDRELLIWPEHCLENSWGAEIIEELKPEDKDIVIKKKTYDGFFETELESILKKEKIDTLIFMGVVTEICVFHTASSAALRGFKVVLLKDCVMSLNIKDAEFVERHIKNVFGGKVMSSSELLHSPPI